MEFSPIRPLIESTESLVTWLIPEFLPQGALVALAGMPGAGKSFLSYTLAMAVATGTETLGFHLDQPARVLYFDQENSPHDSAQYFRWVWYGLNQPSLDLIDQNLFYAHWQLGTHDWPMHCANAITMAQPHFIIFDTCSAVFNIQDENDNAEATRIINRLRALMRLVTPSPTVIVLKHAKFRPDNNGYTLRGAKAWEGAVDGVIYQIRKEGAARADGLRQTRLEPAKARAFGLRDTLHIDPQWTHDGAGLRLSRTPR